MNVNQAIQKSRQFNSTRHAGAVLILFLSIVSGFGDLYYFVCGCLFALLFSIIMQVICCLVEDIKFRLMVKAIENGRKEYLKILGKN